jgi:type I protein arginine methyltransferase
VYRLIDYGPMLRDRARIEAYRRALSAVITPASVVLDVGAGLGTFSVLAAKLGAARVYAVEPADVIAVAEEIARANGVADRIRFIQARVEKAELPEQADVIVSDLASALPLFEAHLTVIAGVRERFLKPGGVLIPGSARLFCAPVGSAAIHAGIVEVWHSVPDVDFGPAVAMALQTPHARIVKPEDLAGEPRVWGELDYTTLNSPNVTGSAEWETAATVYGIALWFENTLHGEVRSSSGPWSPGSVHATMVLPLVEPLEPGRLRLDIEAALADGRYVTTWHARTERQAGRRQSTFLSEPRSAASLLDRAEHLGGLKPAAPQETRQETRRYSSARPRNARPPRTAVAIPARRRRSLQPLRARSTDPPPRPAARLPRSCMVIIHHPFRHP